MTIGISKERLMVVRENLRADNSDGHADGALALADALLAEVKELDSLNVALSYAEEILKDYGHVYVMLRRFVGCDTHVALRITLITDNDSHHCDVIIDEERTNVVGEFESRIVHACRGIEVAAKKSNPLERNNENSKTNS